MTKRIRDLVVWVLSGLMSLGLSTAFAQSQTTMTTRATELRADKLAAAPVVQALASGAALRVLSVEGGWVLVETTAPPGVSGARPAAIPP
jgi:hypothetical protein